MTTRGCGEESTRCQRRSLQSSVIHSTNIWWVWLCARTQGEITVTALTRLTILEVQADCKYNMVSSTELSHDICACNICSCNYTAKRERENNQRNKTVVHPPFLPLSNAPASAQDDKEKPSDLQFFPLLIAFLGVIIAHLTDTHLSLKTRFSSLKVPKLKPTTSSGHQSKRWDHFHHWLGWTS